MRKTEIIENKVVHTLRFMGTGKHDAHLPDPRVVETRLVRDLTEIPCNALHLFFEDIVRTTLRVPVGRSGNDTMQRIICSGPVNIDRYMMARSAHGAALLQGLGLVSIDVHPSLQGRVWVFGDTWQARRQQNTE